MDSVGAWDFGAPAHPSQGSGCGTRVPHDSGGAGRGTMGPFGIYTPVSPAEAPGNSE